MLYAVGTQRIQHRGSDRRWRADGAAFPGALDPQEVGRRRFVLVQLCLEAGQVARARQRIVHQGAGQELAVPRVVAYFLKDRLTDALGQASVGLSVHDRQADDPARVVHAVEAVDADLSRVGVDLDLADITPVGKAERRLGFSRCPHRLVGLRRHQFAHCDLAVGADDRQRPIGERNVLLRGFEPAGGEGLETFDKILACHGHRGPTGVERAGTVTSRTFGGGRRVALHDVDGFGG